MLGALFGCARLALRGQPPTWALRLGAGFVAALLAGVLAGGLTGNGFSAWGESVLNLDLHRRTWTTTRVGLDTLVVFGPELVERAWEDRSVPRVPNPPRGEVERRQRERRPAAIALKLAALALLGAALWRTSPVEGAVLGMVALFVISGAESYYWIMLCTAPLGRAPPAVLATLALGPPLYAIAIFVYPEFAYIHLRYVCTSIGLTGLFLLWTVPDAVRTLRGGTTSA